MKNTKVQEMTPDVATREGIDYLDAKGDRRGYCYCCGRIGFKLNGSGELSRHGYQRPGWGYDVGGCHGTRRTPEATLLIAIKWHHEQITKLEALLATDLFAFAIRQGRQEVKADREKYYRHYHQRHTHLRDGLARAFRALRAGEDTCYSLKGVDTWRRILTPQLDSHRREVKVLEAIL